MLQDYFCYHVVEALAWYYCTQSNAFGTFDATLTHQLTSFNIFMHCLKQDLQVLSDMLPV